MFAYRSEPHTRSATPNHSTT